MPSNAKPTHLRPFFCGRLQKYVADAVGHGEQHALRQRHHRQVRTCARDVRACVCVLRVVRILVDLRSLQ